MALRGAAGRNLVGAGFTLIGITAWMTAAVTIGQPRAAFLGVTLGGMLAMVGLALCVVPRRRVRIRYFAES
jgi:hypothetical protein